MIFVTKTRSGEKLAASQKAQKRLLTERDAELDRVRKHSDQLRALRLEKEAADAVAAGAKKAEKEAAKVTAKGAKLAAAAARKKA